MVVLLRLIMLIAAATAAAQDPITNEAVVKMRDAGLADEVIVQAIDQQGGKFSISPNDLISLKAAGVSDKVIAAMLRKASPSPPAGDAAAAAVSRVSSGPQTYRTIQVMRFDQRPGTGMPQETLSGLMGGIHSELAETGKFERILTDGETAETGKPCLRLTGTVVKFSKGSRATRYLLGPASLAGPGKSVVKAHIKLLDNGTGEVLHEQDVDGRVWIGFFGGSSDGAKHGLAKEVAKVLNKKFF